MKRPAFIRAFCCLLLFAPLTSALAQPERDTTPGASSSSATSSDPAEASSASLERTRLLRALIPLSLTLVALGGVLVFYVRKRRDRDVDADQRHDPAELAFLEAHAQPVYVEPRAQSAYARGEFGAGNAVLGAAPEHEADASIAFVAVDSEPFTNDDDAPGAPPIDALDTSVACMACDQCQKRFELGTTFCTHDGSILIRVDITGDERDDDEESDTPPPTPLLYCTRCTREAPIGEERCATCEGPLLFMLGRRTRGLSLSGDGERTHICPECRTQYDDAASFCGRDGAPLRPIN